MLVKTINNQIRLSIFLGMILLSPSVVSADYESGCKAFKIRDYKTALYEFKRSANKGNASAQFALGVLYMKDRGAPQDYKKALKWFSISAKQGNAFGLYAIGLMYDQGNGLPMDHEEAVNWYTKSAEHGFTDAQIKLGFIYSDYASSGVPHDKIKAHMWFYIADLKGNEMAHDLSRMTSNKMTPQQIAEAQKLAREWMERFNKIR